MKDKIIEFFTSALFKLIVVVFIIAIVGGTINKLASDGCYEEKRITDSDIRILFDEVAQINTNLIKLIELKKGELNGSKNN